MGRIDSKNKGGNMRGRSALFITILLLLAMSSAAMAWEGRMAGMSDPYGLISDESDFLVHPAVLADSKGTQYYAFYKFLYKPTNDLDLDIRSPLGVLEAWMPMMLPANFHASGDVMENEALVGTSFALGTGRMGIFIGYRGTQGDFDSSTQNILTGTPDIYNADTGLDNFAVRVLYALPIGDKLKFGAEFQLSYQQEDNTITETRFGIDSVNSVYARLFPMAPPRNADFIEALFKTGVQGEFGRDKIAVTARGGALLSSNNSLDYAAVNSSTGRTESGNFNGDVGGWSVGGDFWLRHQVSDALALPFVVRGDYQYRNYSNAAVISPGVVVTAPFSVGVDNPEKLLKIEAGGGLDYTLKSGMRLGAGLYYDYIRNESSFRVRDILSSAAWDELYDYAPFPVSTEHQVRLRLTAEQALNKDLTVRGGIDFFRGWVREETSFSDLDLIVPPNWYVINAAPEGEHWGIIGSIGATAAFGSFTVEPFVQGGWQKLSLNDNNMQVSVYSAPVAGFSADKDREEVLVAAGFAVRF